MTFQDCLFFAICRFDLSYPAASCELSRRRRSAEVRFRYQMLVSGFVSHAKSPVEHGEIAGSNDICRGILHRPIARLEYNVYTGFTADGIDHQRSVSTRLCLAYEHT